MTATDQPKPRVGDTVRAESAAGLPVGSVLVHPFDPAWTLTRGAYPGSRPWVGSDGRRWASEEAELNGFRVLFRPDAPHPAPVDGDAVERAAEGMSDYLTMLGVDPDDLGEGGAGTTAQVLARAALAAAHTGEAVDREARDVALVLVEHAPSTEHDLLVGCRCGWGRDVTWPRYVTLAQFAQHQAEQLASLAAREVRS